MVSGRPINPAEARALMIRNGCEPKTEFIKAKDPWPAICLRCGEDIQPTYDSIATKARKHGDAPRGCRPCADQGRAEQHRLDEAELAMAAATANIQPLEPYRNNSTGWECLCLNEGCPRTLAGKPIKVLMKVVRRGGMACRYCSRKEIHPDDAAAMMIEHGRVQPKVLYPGIDQPWLGDCLRCGEEVRPRLHDVKNGGQGGCARCAPNAPLTLDQAWDRAISYRFRPLDKFAFRNTNAPWDGICLDCGAPVSPCLGNLYRGQGACNSSSCKITGFNDGKPGLVYLLHRGDEPAAAKIGICEDGPRNTRLSGHARAGWQVAHTLPFKAGLHARLVEAAIKRLWFVDRSWRRGRGDQRINGYTETVVLHDPDRAAPWTTLVITDLWTDVMVQAKQLGFASDELRSQATDAATD